MFQVDPACAMERSRNWGGSPAAVLQMPPLPAQVDEEARVVAEAEARVLLAVQARADAGDPEAAQL